MPSFCPAFFTREEFTTSELSSTECNNRSLQFYYFAWLYGNKGVIVGRAIGEFLTGKEIPPAFKTVIEAKIFQP